MSIHEVLYFLRQSYKCSADSVRIVRIWLDSVTIYKNVLGNTVRTQNASMNYVQIKDNLWQFFTIREIFSLRLGFKCHLPLLGYYFPNKCSSESCCSKIYQFVAIREISCSSVILKFRILNPKKWAEPTYV